MGYHSVLELNQEERTVTVHTKPDSTLLTYDHVAGAESTQEDVFQKVGKPISDTCLAGYNGTIFAYGQTGSGKTHTIQGATSMGTDPSQRGVMPRVFQYLCAQIAREERKSGGRLKYSVTASFLEIYNERIFDLLEPNSQSLTLREDAKEGVYVENLHEVPITAADEILKLMEMGIQNRRVGETAMNRESSRSHSVFRLALRSTLTENGITKTKHSLFHLIDLAGSERQKATAAVGARLKEASGINKSLSALGNVIMALVAESRSGKARHVHYRDSKLTFLLRDSLGGNSLTYIIACVSPAGDSFGETLSTLKFAQRAKLIKNKAVINEDHTGSVDALQAEVKELKELVRNLTALQSANTRRLSVSGNANSPTSFADFMTPRKRHAEAPGVFSARRDPAAPAVRDVLVGDGLKRERAWLESNNVLKEKIDLLESLVDKQSKSLLSSKMMLTLRERALKKLEGSLKSGISDESAQELLFAELERYQHENKALNEQLVVNPAVVAKAIEVVNLRQRLGELENKECGLNTEERFVISDKLAELMGQNAGLNNNSPQKLWAALSTPQKRSCESFELQRWRQEQDFENQTMQLKDEMLGAKEEAIGYKAALEDVEAEKEIILRNMQELSQALNEQQVVTDALKLRHEDELSRLLAKHAEDEEAVHAIYEEEIRALSSGAHQSSEQSFELANTRAKLLTLEGEMKLTKERLATSEMQSASHSERLVALGKQLDEERQESQLKLSSANKLCIARAAELVELERQLAHSLQQAESIQSLQAQLISTQNSLEASQQREGARADEVDRLEQLCETTRAEVDRVTFNLEMLQEDHDNMAHDFSFQESFVTELKNKKEALEAAVAEKDSILARTLAKVDEKTEEIKQLKEELKHVAAQGSEGEMQLVASKQALEDTVEEQQRIISDLNEELEAEIRAVSKQETMVDQLKKESAVLQEALEDVRTAFKDLQEKLAAKEYTCAGIVQELGDKVEQIVKYEEQLNILSNRLGATEAELKESQQAEQDALEQRKISVDQIMEELRVESNQSRQSQLRVQQLEEEVTSMSERLKEAQSLECKIKGDFEAAVKAHKITEERHSASLYSLHSQWADEVQALNSRVTLLDSERISQQLAVRNLEQAVEVGDEHRQQVQALEAMVRSSQNRAHEISSELRAKEQALSAAALNLDAIQSDMQVQATEHEAQVQALRAANEDLQTQNLQIALQAATLSQELEAMATTMHMQIQTATEKCAEQAAAADSQTLEVARMEAHSNSLAAQLRQSIQDKQGYLEDLHRCRVEEERAFDEADKLRCELEQLHEEVSSVKENMRKLEAERDELSNKNAKLIGHQNPKQKIHHHMKIKQENDMLKQTVAALEKELRRPRKKADHEKENTMPEEDVNGGRRAQEELDLLTSAISKLGRSTDCTSVKMDECLKEIHVEPAQCLEIVRTLKTHLTESRQEVTKLKRQLVSKERDLLLMDSRKKLAEEAQVFKDLNSKTTEDFEDFQIFRQ